MDDESYEGLFRPIMDTIMANYQPDAIVLQSGEWNVQSCQMIEFFQRLCGLRSDDTAYSAYHLADQQHH